MKNRIWLVILLFYCNFMFLFMGAQKVSADSLINKVAVDNVGNMYVTLQEAIDSSKGETTLKVLRSIELEKTIMIDETKSIVLDLNGSNITMKASANVISNKGNLKIINTGSSSNIVGTTLSVIINSNGGLLQIDSSEIHISNTGSATGSCLGNGPGSSVVINKNAKFLCNIGFSNRGEMTLNSGYIAPTSGSGIENLAGGVLKIYGDSKITTKSTNEKHNAINNSGELFVNLNDDGRIFIKNSTKVDSRVIFNTGSFTFEEGKIEADCVAVYVKDSSAAYFKMNGGKISTFGNCGESKSAIGVYSDYMSKGNKSQLLILGGLIDSTGDEAVEDVKFYGIDAELTDLQVENAKIKSRNIGIRVVKSSLLINGSSDIVSNDGIHSEHSVINMSNGSIKGKDKYGVYSYDGSSVNIVGGAIYGKDAGIYSFGESNIINVGRANGTELSTGLISGDSFGIVVNSPSSSLNFYSGKIRGIRGIVAGVEITANNPVGNKLLEAEETEDGKIYKYLIYEEGTADLEDVPETENREKDKIHINWRNGVFYVVCAVVAGTILGLILLVSIHKIKAKRKLR